MRSNVSPTSTDEVMEGKYHQMIYTSSRERECVSVMVKMFHLCDPFTTIWTSRGVCAHTLSYGQCASPLLRVRAGSPGFSSMFKRTRPMWPKLLGVPVLACRQGKESWNSLPTLENVSLSQKLTHEGCGVTTRTQTGPEPSLSWARAASESCSRNILLKC